MEQSTSVIWKSIEGSEHSLSGRTLRTFPGSPSRMRVERLAIRSRPLPSPRVPLHALILIWYATQPAKDPPQLNRRN